MIKVPHSCAVLKRIKWYIDDSINYLSPHFLNTGCLGSWQLSQLSVGKGRDTLIIMLKFDVLIKILVNKGSIYKRPAVFK